MLIMTQVYGLNDSHMTRKGFDIGQSAPGGTRSSSQTSESVQHQSEKNCMEWNQPTTSIISNDFYRVQSYIRFVLTHVVCPVSLPNSLHKDIPARPMLRMALLYSSQHAQSSASVDRCNE